MVHPDLLSDQCYFVQLSNYQEFDFHFFHGGSSYVLFWDEKLFPSFMGIVSGYSLKSPSPKSSIHWMCGHLMCVLDHTNTVVIIMAFSLYLADLCLHPLVPGLVVLLLLPAPPVSTVREQLDLRTDLTSYKKKNKTFGVFCDTGFLGFFSFSFFCLFFFFFLILKKRLVFWFDIPCGCAKGSAKITRGDDGCCY